MHVTGGVERDHRVGVGTPGTHLGGHPDRLHELLLGRALAQGCLRMAADAVRALGDVRDGHRDDLLGLLVERTVREDLPAEFLEGVVGVGSELLALLGELGGDARIEIVCHDFGASSGSSIWTTSVGRSAWWTTAPETLPSSSDRTPVSPRERITIAVASWAPATSRIVFQTGPVALIATGSASNPASRAIRVPSSATRARSSAAARSSWAKSAMLAISPNHGMLPESAIGCQTLSTSACRVA